jgi:hypothetical protein
LPAGAALTDPRPAGDFQQAQLWHRNIQEIALLRDAAAATQQGPPGEICAICAH